MKNFKDITLSIFAIIGFLAILSSFNNQTEQETHGTPESHVWEMHSIRDANNFQTFSFNKLNVEVRKHNPGYLNINNKTGEIVDIADNKYAVMVEAK